MKYLLFLLIIIGFAACDKPYQKPFIITGKEPYCKNNSQWYYEYQDINGRIGTFIDNTDTFNIGQNLK